MRLLFALTSALALAGLGCSSGPACVIDTDCPLGNRCGDDGACHVVGMRTDSGPTGDAGPPRDAPAGDVRASDAPSGDTRPDSGGDSGASCPATAGTTPLMSVGVGCTGLTATNVTLVESPTVPCSFEVQLDTRSAGTIAPEGSIGPSELAGMIDYGNGSVRCVATFDGAGGITFMCADGCMFTAARP